ncbi:MAG: DUF4835 family protein [Bacteroidetes bacterium]|nr:DUF4835 family protein [Bacteroidota bacterium]
MIRKGFVTFFFILIAHLNYSQEFLGNIQVQSQKIQGIDPTVFTTMKTSMFEFMNNQSWSDYRFKIEERIEFAMVFTINEVIGGDDFKGTLNLVLKRPVYGTDYNSDVINIIDNDIHFRYVPYQSMEFVDGTYSNNLTSILAFYAYIMMGLDFDTFSLLGGTAYYEKAMAVATAAQSSNERGWQGFEGPKNRYSLVENLLNPSYEDLRKFLYEYHLKGLDEMAKSVDGGRTSIGKTLKYFQNVYNKRPGLYLLQVLLESKRDEIINIYKEASPAEKISMINMMKEIDPANGTRYEMVNEKY